MLVFTPEIEDVFRLFALTHEQEVGLGGAVWHRICFPARGGLDEQDAIVMQQLEYLRSVMTGIAVTQRRKGHPAGELERFRKAHGRNR